ncbi:ComEC/Rec2 family competence protein [Alteromonas sp. S015]|uniref:ComEC/Rec2 family competence protein n=1 Tax=Alteromonas sp. S015 TaxID=3117401 RepID=UPI003F68AE42
MALMIAILVTSAAIILLFSVKKLSEFHALPEVLLCWAVCGLLSGVLWVASLGHFYYAWQLPQGKIQQDVIISGEVMSGGCVSSLESVPGAAYQYVVAIKSVNGESTAAYLNEGALFPVFKRLLTSTFVFKARLSHKHYAFRYNINDQSFRFHNAVLGEKYPSKTQRLAKPKNFTCLHNGDTFSAVVRLKPAYGTANPVGASRQQQLLSQFIHATGYIKSINHNQTQHNHSVRQALATTLKQQNLINYSWWRALLLGDKTDFTLHDWTLLQRSGTGHIFSISGMHLSLIAAVSLLLFNPVIFLLAHLVNALESAKDCFNIKINYRYKATSRKQREQCNQKVITTKAPIRTTVLVSLVVACFLYALLSGSALPVVRALVLLTVGCFLSLSRLAWRPVNIALTMLALNLLLFPFSMLSASFYLSSVAVVCIWFLVVIWGLKRAPWYVSLFKLQIALTVLIMPLTLIWFGSASFISIIANLIALPVITVLLPICLLSLLSLHFIEFVFIQHLSGTLMHYSDACLGYLLSLLNRLSDVSFSAIDFHVSSSAALCLVGALFVLLLPTWRYKTLCVVLLLLPLVSTIKKWLPSNETLWALHVFDAGQASAIAITKGDRAIIIDSGAQFNGIAHTATEHLLPFLESKHVESIDVVIHTHSDNDHAGGALAVQQHSLATHATFYTPTLGCERGKQLVWQNLTISFLWPLKGNEQDNNAMSCVVKIASKSSSVLIPGDIEKASEYALITREINESRKNRASSLRSASLNTSRTSPSKLSADILVAPHHGSKTSSTNVFIEHVAPKVVIFTQGFENRWQFPARAVAKRYERFGATQYLTSYHGYIRANFDNDSFYIDTQRATLQNRWYLPGIAPRHLKE